METIRQNLLEKARSAANLGYRSPILYKEEVENYVNDVIPNLFSRDTRGGREFIESKIKELQELRNDFERRERAVYQALGGENCDSLQEFKKDIDSKIESLYNLSNEALRQMPLIEKMRKETYEKIPEEEILEKLQQKVDDLVFVRREANKKERFNTTARAVRDALYNELVSSGTSKKGLERALEEAIVVLPEGKKRIVLEMDEKIIKKYKKSFQKILAPTAEITNVGRNGFFVQVKIEEENGGNSSANVLTYYPYYRLTEEEKQEASELRTDKSKDIWKNFQVQLCNMIEDNNLRKTAKEVFSNEVMKPEDFFADSYGQVVGILGEFSTLVLFGSFKTFNGKGSFPQYVGNLYRTVNGKSGKIDIDVLLENGAGIQVKNYHIYGNNKSKNSGIWLPRGRIKLNTLLNQISSGNFDNGLQTMADYYTMRTYHVLGGEGADFKDALKQMDITDSFVKSAWQGYINSYLATNIYNDIDGVEEAQNLFYFVGGEYLVPISKIIDAYIKYLIELIKSGNNHRALVVENSYQKGNDTYANFYKLWTGAGFESSKKKEKDEYMRNFAREGYDNVYNNIYMTAKVNINFDYILKEIIKESKNS